MSTVSVRKVVSCTNVVRTAIENTPREYWDKLCRTRARGDALQAGSYLPFHAGQVDRLMKELEWEAYTHAAVKAPATAFIAAHVFGVMNVIHIDQVPQGETLSFEDPKGLGKLECVWRTNRTPQQMNEASVDFVVAIVGPDSAGKDIVYTFHPGDPVSPSELTNADLLSLAVTPHEAKGLGVEWVKVAYPLEGTNPAK